MTFEQRRNKGTSRADIWGKSKCKVCGRNMHGFFEKQRGDPCGLSQMSKVKSIRRQIQRGNGGLIGTELCRPVSTLTFTLKFGGSHGGFWVE